MSEIKSFFTGPGGDNSIKRLIALLGFLVLAIALFLNFKFQVKLDPNLIDAIKWIVGICIIGTVGEKFSPQINDIMNKADGKNSKGGS